MSIRLLKPEWHLRVCNLNIFDAMRLLCGFDFRCVTLRSQITICGLPHPSPCLLKEAGRWRCFNSKIAGEFVPLVARVISPYGGRKAKR